MSEKRTVAQKERFCITVRAQIVKDVKEIYTINAISTPEAVKQAVANFKNEHSGTIIDCGMEIDVSK